MQRRHGLVLTGVPHGEFIAVDRDAGSLAGCKAPIKIHIGNQLNKELGTDEEPAMNRPAAEQSMEALRDVLRGADTIFITAGMGDGFGSSAAPLVARIARESGAVAVGIVTKPFSFEGVRRRRLADEGAKPSRNR